MSKVVGIECGKPVKENWQLYCAECYKELVGSGSVKCVVCGVGVKAGYLLCFRCSSRALVHRAIKGEVIS